MSINKLQAALASATNELTLTAANINFDFAIVKCEAPKEYQNLGNALSKYKKDKAENGTAHTTARKLGALFDGVCPPTPNLIKAYGLRVSEIAETATKLEKQDHGIFAAHTGVDGTSIWASATSSVAALQLQLLACMLAKVWKASQATSIWYELVKERRAEIASKYEEGEEVPFKSMTAAVQSEISRDSLAEWDASARAWLQVADKVKAREQTKLRLIIDSVDTAVNDDRNVFSSVMAAWRVAVVSMENLLRGMPQAIESGPAIVALSSWHIYPNILIASNGIKEVVFEDALIPAGAKFTVGFDLSPGQIENRGVYWSLSLQHLQSYGRPVQTEGRLNRDMSKVTFQDFCQAILGCVLGSWGIQGFELEPVCRVFILLQKVIEKAATSSDDEQTRAKEHAQQFLRDKTHWWHILARAATDYCDPDEEMKKRLTKLGLRRSRQFLPDHDDDRLFGLTNSADLMYFLKRPEDRVKFLRRIVANTVAGGKSIPTNYSVIIQYVDRHSKNKFLGHLATAIPCLAPVKNRERDPDATSEITYIQERWIHPEDVSYFPGEVVHRAQEDRDFFLCHQYDSTMLFWPAKREYVLVYGSQEVAAIYQDIKAPNVSISKPSIEDVIWMLEQNMISVHALINHLKRLDSRSTLVRTMNMVSCASNIYQAVPSATVCIEVLNKPLHTSKWADFAYRVMHIGIDNQLSPAPKPPTRELALSCVAYLSCSTDIDPSLLTEVFAMAHEDSLYIATQLTCDPSEDVQPYELQKVLGNVGRAGITMLVPPKDPIVQQVDASSWQVIENNCFDGKELDCYSKTSLHLSFTEYCVPLYQITQHGRDHGVFFLESVVSVHDSETWIGDVDILKALNDPRVVKMGAITCGHKEQGADHEVMISVEGWPDIIDPPRDQFVVRSYGNWVGRLAAVGMLSQTLTRDGRSVISICPKSVCWKCTLVSRKARVRAFVY